MKYRVYSIVLVSLIHNFFSASHIYGLYYTPASVGSINVSPISFMTLRYKPMFALLFCKVKICSTKPQLKSHLSSDKK